MIAGVSIVYSYHRTQKKRAELERDRRLAQNLIATVEEESGGDLNRLTSWDRVEGLILQGLRLVRAMAPVTAYVIRLLAEASRGKP